MPEIYAEDLSQGAYLEEDLGDTTLFDFLSMNRVGETISLEMCIRDRSSGMMRLIFDESEKLTHNSGQMRRPMEMPQRVLCKLAVFAFDVLGGFCTSLNC